MESYLCFIYKTHITYKSPDAKSPAKLLQYFADMWTYAYTWNITPG
jgi:hypothetical protein